MIHEQSFNSFEEIRQYFDNTYADDNENFVFRGHADANWHLVSTLNRLINSARASGAKSESIEKFVAKHLKRFRAEIKGRRGSNPPKLDTDDEVWALGQHYGLATPLLDWTNSPYIALFFAFDSFLSQKHDHKRCVWALNKKVIKRINESIEIEEEKLKFFNPETEDNIRIISQSGLFTKISVKSSVDQWVKEYSDGNESALTKIVIPEEIDTRKKILKHLELMHITFSTIYPDLIGASKYCNVKAENYEI